MVTKRGACQSSSNPEYMQATQVNVVLKIEEVSRLNRIRNVNIIYREN